MEVEGLGEEKFIPRGRSTVKNKERGRGRGRGVKMSPHPRPLATPSILTANQKLAGRRNDRELLALARTNKTPALQATDISWAHLV